MSRPSVGQLIDLSAQLERDAELVPDRLRRRDRELGRALGDHRDPHGRVAAWLDRVRSGGDETPGETVDRVQRALAVWLAVLGALLGSGLAATLYWYDGSHPVNVIRILAVFVALQAALLVATALLCLPTRWQRFVPGLGLLQDALSLASPGRWQGGLGRWLPGGQRAAVERWRGLVRRHRALYGDVERWWLLAGSQGFGVAFHAGAIATALFLVAFTDLAFGWSTTLQIDGEALLAATRQLSFPWSAVASDAVPQRALVESTQYFRASGEHDPSGSAPWWPFLLACMLVYGLFPRVLFLGFAHWRLGRAVAEAFERIPGLAALHDRLDHALIETAGPGESAAELPAADATSATALEPGLACRALLWSGLPLDAEAASQGLGLSFVGHARAGEGSLDDDARVLDAIREAGGDEPVLVLVKAWEPPVLEFLDFLQDLRAVLAEARPVVVVPLSVGEDGAPGPPSERDAAQWLRALDRLGDPFTRVHLAASLVP